MANAPLWDGMAGDMEVIWVSGEGKYFCRGGLDGWKQPDPKGEFFLYAKRVRAWFSLR
jgi:hypothetical protein